MACQCCHVLAWNSSEATSSADICVVAMLGARQRLRPRGAAYEGVLVWFRAKWLQIG